MEYEIDFNLTNHCGSCGEEGGEEEEGMDEETGGDEEAVDF